MYVIQKYAICIINIYCIYIKIYCNKVIKNRIYNIYM